MKKIMRKTIKELGILLLLAYALVSFAQPSGEIIIALTNDPTSLYLPRGADRTAGNASWPLYNGLVTLNDDGDIAPDLATSWEISEDGRSYTFVLREGVTFHNGEAFTADDVVATWEFGKDESNDYAEQFSNVSEVEVIDPYTVRIVTADPDPLFLSRLVDNWGIIPGDYVREVGLDAFAAAPIGTGPFQLVERISGDRIVHEANPNYWEEGYPKLERITFRIIPDASTRVAAVQAGDIHIANRLNAEEADLLRDASGVSVLSYGNDRVYYVAFKNIGNGVGTPLEHVKVRQALNYAVNRPGIVQAFFNGEAELVAGFTISSNLGYDDSIAPYPYDVAKAKELMAEAGYADGFALTMGCPADYYPSGNEVCLQVGRDLAQVGVNVDVEYLTSSTFWSEPNYGATGPIFLDSWSSSVGEALPRLEGAMTPGATYNAWEDATIVDYVERISTTVDRDARAALYVELQQYMKDNPPFIYMYALNIFEGVRDEVQGYVPHPAENYFLKNVSLDN